MHKGVREWRVRTRKASHGEQDERKVAIDRLVRTALCRLPSEGATGHVRRNAMPTSYETYTMTAARRPCKQRQCPQCPQPRQGLTLEMVHTSRTCWVTSQQQLTHATWREPGVWILTLWRECQRRLEAHSIVSTHFVLNVL